VHVHVDLGVVLVLSALERTAGGALGSGPPASRHIEPVPRRGRPARRNRSIRNVPGPHQPRLTIDAPVADRDDAGREDARGTRIAPLALLVVVVPLVRIAGAERERRARGKRKREEATNKMAGRESTHKRHYL